MTGKTRTRDTLPATRRLRVLLAPDSVYWVTGTIAKSIATANPWIEPTIISGPLLEALFESAESMARRFDLVHFICPYSSREWLPRLRGLLPVVTSHHHVTSWDLIRHNLDGDAIVAGSQEWVRDLSERDADMTRVFRVPYGVDVDLFSPARPGEREAIREKLRLTGTGPVIGFFAKKASNDDERKGTDVFADAVMLLHEKLPSTGALIVGPGWQELVRRFRDAGIACAWLPFVEEPSGIPPLYQALDFYWVTARVEGGPVPLLEAMSSEICCLSTPVGLAREVVRDGINGFLLPMNDPAAFADRTAELWDDATRRETTARAGRETMMSEMRADEMARLVRPVYERAIENFAARNSGARVPVIPDRDCETAPGSESVPRAGLSAPERRRAEMLEALAWSENLILYQNQTVAAVRLILRAWRENPSSLEPPRILLRRLLPEPVVRSVVGIKRSLRGHGREARASR
jgi:glycosyltransferase involved in cell wall biosynthesis